MQSINRAIFMALVLNSMHLYAEIIPAERMIQALNQCTQSHTEKKDLLACYADATSPKTTEEYTILIESEISNGEIAVALIDIGCLMMKDSPEKARLQDLFQSSKELLAAFQKSLDTLNAAK